MSANNGLCLRFDLDTFASRHAYIADVGWGAYAYLARILRIAAVFDVKFQFCACGEGMKEYPFEIEQIRAAGHPIDSHLYTHRVTLLDPAERVAEELVLTERMFKRHRVPWSGIGATGMYPRGIDDRPEIQALLVERGYQWCSTRYREGSLLEACQPYWLDEHLLEIPCVGLSDRRHFYDRDAPVGRLIEILCDYLRSARDQDMVCCIDLHPGVLACFDPDCELVTHIVEQAIAWDVPVVTMDQISQWQIARREVERFERGERLFEPAWWHDGQRIDFPPAGPLTLARWLEAQAYWDKNWAQPDTQPEKMMDYVGGWRPYPNSYRNGVSINRFGLRGPDTLRTVQMDRQRVLCIGDSCVFGTKPDDAPWPAQLQVLLDQRAPLRYEVLNACINGQASDHVALRMPQLIRGLRPDVVIIAVLANDLWDLWQTEDQQQIDWAVFQPTRFMSNVQAAVDICLTANVRPVLITIPGLVPTDYRMTPFMLACYHQASALGETKQPDKKRRLYDLYNDALRELAQKNNLPCIDTAAEFDRRLDQVRGRLFIDTCHMVKEGNAEIAQIIADNFNLLSLSKTSSESCGGE